MPPFALSELKLRRPAGRPGIVTRPALIDRLSSVETPGVISVVAPAGYGKTTLLAQWAESWQPRVAWVSADRRDNDPAVLLAYLATALDGSSRSHPRCCECWTSSVAAITVVPSAGRPRSRRCASPWPWSSTTRRRSPTRSALDTIAELALVLSGRIPVCHRLAGHRCRCRRPGCARTAASSRSAPTTSPCPDREAAALLSGAGVDVGAQRRRRPRPAHRGLAGGPLPRRAGDAGRQSTRRSRVLGHR